MGKAIGTYIACLLSLEQFLGLTSGGSFVLDDGEHRGSSTSLGRRPQRSDLEVTTAMENAPGDASKFVGERNRKFEPIEPASCSLDPGFEAMLLPALRAQQDGPGCLDEKHSQVAIAALGDGPEDCAPAR